MNLIRSRLYSRKDTGSLMHWSRSSSAFFDAICMRSSVRPDCAGSRPLFAAAATTKRTEKSPPVFPELPLPDPCVVQPRSVSFSTTSHGTRLPLPKKAREPSTRSRRETANFHKNSCLTSASSAVYPLLIRGLCAVYHRDEKRCFLLAAEQCTDTFLSL